MKIEIRFSGAPPEEIIGAERMIVTMPDSNVFEFNQRKSGLFVRTAMPISHTLQIMPMGSNCAVLFHKPEPE